MADTFYHMPFFFFFFWPHLTACGILVLRPGIEPTPPASEARSLNHWTTREVPHALFNGNSHSWQKSSDKDCMVDRITSPPPQCPHPRRVGGLAPLRVSWENPSQTQITRHISLGGARPHSRLQSGQWGSSSPVETELPVPRHLGQMSSELSMVSEAAYLILCPQRALSDTKYVYHPSPWF